MRSTKEKFTIKCSVRRCCRVQVRVIHGLLRKDGSHECVLGRFVVSEMKSLTIVGIVIPHEHVRNYLRSASPLPLFMQQVSTQEYSSASSPALSAQDCIQA